MTTASEQYQEERSAFALYLRGQADWRRAKAEEYPDDMRNVWAAELYDAFAALVEGGEFNGHLGFGAFALDVEAGGVIGGGNMDGLDRLGFNGNDEPTVEFFDELLHRVGIAHYVGDIEGADALKMSYAGAVFLAPSVREVLEERGYVEDGRIVRPLPDIDAMVAEVRDWMAAYVAHNPVAVAAEKLRELETGLAYLLTFLDQPKVRKQLARADDSEEMRTLISDMAMLGSQASLTAARLSSRNARSRYLG